jgi:sec-independent protein translocase protein TatC
MALVPFPGTPAPYNGDPDDDESSGADKMSFLEHLDELRKRLIVSVSALAIGFVVSWAYVEKLLDFIFTPLAATIKGGRFQYFEPGEAFMLRMKLAALAGLFLALPVILWQIWRFIVPALNAKEKKYAIPFVLSSVVLFIAGGTLAYLTVAQALDFLISWAGNDVGQVFSVSSYIALIGLMIFAFGIGFLLPVLIVFLQLVGAVQPRMLMKGWRYALVGIAVTAAVITPSGDPVTMMLLGGPMLVLYFVAVFIGWLVLRRRPPAT